MDGLNTRMAGTEETLMNWKKQQQKLPNLNNRKKTDGKETTNRASGICGMITENIAFVISVMKGEEKESRPEKNDGKLLKISHLLRFGQQYISVGSRNRVNPQTRLL